MRTRGTTKATLLPGRGPLSRIPAPAVFLVVVAIFAAGVVVRGPMGAGLLALLAAGVVVLLAATWPVLAPAQRGARLLVLLVLIGVAVSLFVR